jgi:pimeloyl-ACP methyl ester carboxylesterase
VSDRERAGEPAIGRRVLFLPGAGGDGRFWRPVADRLPPAWERVLLEWPGLGHVPPDPQVRGLDDLVRLVLARAGDDPVDLVAQSMGGLVALLAALVRPELVRRLVLTATSGGLNLTPFGVEDWRPEYVREFPTAAPWIRQVHVDLTDRLATVGHPTLLLWGDADPISPVAVGERLNRLLPRARLVVIPGGDHAFARDRAPDVAPEVARHLSAP